MIRLAMFCTVLTLTAAGCSNREPPADPSAEFFPTKVGTIWVYHVTIAGEDMTLTFTILETEPTNGSDVQLHFGRVNRAGDKSYCGQFTISSSGIFEPSEFPGRAYFRPPRCLLRLPHTDGAVWRDEYRAIGQPYVCDFTAHGPESVTVPAGRYRKAIRVESESTLHGKHPYKETRWFSPGVGLVKWVRPGEVWELRSFRYVEE